LFSRQNGGSNQCQVGNASFKGVHYAENKQFSPNKIFSYNLANLQMGGFPTIGLVNIFAKGMST
jgi:hypothetical protein